MDKEYLEIVQDILFHPEFKKRKKYTHHENESVYEHCISVSLLAYKMAKLIGADYKDAAIAGLLHDFYLRPWQECHTKKKFFEQHGFTHAREACWNAKKWFPQYMNKQVEEAIIKHMFPLNPSIPVYKVSYCVTLADKIVSLKVLAHPMAWPKYLGIKKVAKQVS